MSGLRLDGIVRVSKTGEREHLRSPAHEQVDALDAIADEGRQAGKLARPISDCSAKLDADERRAWRAGWRHGHEWLLANRSRTVPQAQPASATAAPSRARAAPARPRRAHPPAASAAATAPPAAPATGAPAPTAARRPPQKATSSACGASRRAAGARAWTRCPAMRRR
jgi:hypothetical protein